MMRSQSGIQIRAASKEDRGFLADLLYFNAYVHRHLDYRPPLEWLGREPFNLIEKNNRIAATLASPPDPPHVAWIRCFAVSRDIPLTQAWETLLQYTITQLKDEFSSVTHLAAIASFSWLENLLTSSGFQKGQDVIYLQWDGGALPKPLNLPEIKIRSMLQDDLPQVHKVDTAAFPSLWQLSLEYLEYAFAQSMLGSVALLENQIVGYQISSATTMGGHLARLAVHPQAQGRKIGTALLSDLLRQFHKRGVRLVSVNTQEDNLKSIHLYKKAGFKKTGVRFPVYLLEL